MDVCEDVIVKAGDIYHYQGPGQFDPDRFRVEVSELGFALVSDLFVFSVRILTLRHLRDIYDNYVLLCETFLFNLAVNVTHLNRHFMVVV